MLTAFDMFSIYGIKNVSMDDIARNMEISKRTIYEIFKDKEDLLVEGMELNYRKARIYLTQLESEKFTSMEIILLFLEELLKSPRWFNQKFYDDLERFPKAKQKFEEEKNILYKRSVRLLNRGIKEGVFYQNIETDIIALLAKEQLVMLPPLEKVNNHSASEIFQVIIFTFIRGIASDKGKKIMDRFIMKKMHEEKQQQLL